MHIRTTFQVIAVVLLVLLGACARVQTEKRIVAFDDTVRNYGALLRWGHYEEAAKYRVAREGERLAVDIERLKPIRVASYEIAEKVMDPGGKDATVVAVIGYYHEESGVVHTLKDSQHWWYDDQAKAWFLDSELPDFLAHLKKGR